MPGSILLEDLEKLNGDELSSHLQSLLNPGLGPAPAPIASPEPQQTPQELQDHLASLLVPDAAQATPEAVPAAPAPAPAPTPAVSSAPAPTNVMDELASHVENVSGGGLKLLGQGLTSLGEGAQTGLQTLGQGITRLNEPPLAPAPSAVSPSSPPGPTGAGGPLQDYARQAAQKVGIDPEIFVRQIQQESGFNPSARSPAGASGIAQFMPETARGMGVDTSDPYSSLDGAARLMASHLKQYGGDYAKALAAYNAGPGNVEKYGGVPPFEETQRYVSTILGGDRATRPLSDLGYRDTSQFGDAQLTADESYAACGPAAAVRFAQRFGRNPTLREATDLARTVGWTSSQGMAGLQSEKALMDKMGVPTKLVSGADWGTFANEARTGNPVTISTQGHYFTADGWDPQTNRFHVGRSGLDLKGGSEWMTPEQMTSLMGAVQGGLLADNPTVPASTIGTTEGFTAPGEGMTIAQAEAPKPLQLLGEGFNALGGAAQGGLQVLDNAVDTVKQTAGNLVADTSGPQTAAMQPIPSDVLTNPLGTGNAPPTDTARLTGQPAGGIAPPQPTIFDNPPGVVPGVNAGPSGEPAGGVTSLEQVSPLLRGPALMTDEELLGHASPELLATARRFAKLATAGEEPTQAEIADQLRNMRLGEAAALTHTGTGGARDFSYGQAHRLGADALYHETSVRDALGLLTKQQGGPGGELWVSPYRDLALGQGGSKGAVVEFAPSEQLWVQAERSKPASQFVEAERGLPPELRIRRSDAPGNQTIRSITVQPDAPMDAVARRQLQNYLSDWDKETLADGSVKFTNPKAGPVATTAEAPVVPEPRVPEPSVEAPAPTAPIEAPGAAGGPPIVGRGAPTMPEGEGAERAGNILLPKFVQEPVRELINETYAADPARFEAARRGVVPDEVVRELADQTGTNVNRIVSLWKPGQAKNAETLLAMRQGLADRALRVRAAQNALREAPNSLDARATLIEALAQHAAIQEAVAGTTGEAGRALRVLRQPVQGEEASLRLLQRLAREKGLTTTEMADQLTKINLDDPASVAVAARALNNHTIMDKATSLWYFALLSNPMTHIKNTVSNALVMATRPVESLASAGVDVARYGAERAAGRTGAQRERFFGEVPEQLFGYASALPDGLRGAYRMLRTGVSDAALANPELAGRSEPFSGRLADLTVNVPGRALQASDQVFRAMHTQATLRSLAYRQARQEGHLGQELVDRIADLVTNPSQKLIDATKDEGAYRVFQQGGDFVNAMGSLREKAPALKVPLPFVQTPYNVAKYALERTPLGAVKIATDRQGGGVLSDRLARAGLGTATMMYFLDKARDGTITGAAPRDPTERDAFFRQGKQPYSIKVGDTWRSYQSLQPLTTLLGAVAGYAEAVKSAGESGADQMTALGAGGLAMGRALVDQPWLQGMSDLIDLTSGTDVRNPDDVLRTVNKYIQQQATSVIPSIVRATARAQDPTLRDPEQGPQGIAQALAANIPGLQDYAPAKLTAWGEESRRPQSGPGVMFDPSLPSPATDSPLELELERLQKLGYDVQPGFVTNRVTAFNTPVKLTEEEQRQYQRLAGSIAKELLETVVGTPEWEALSDKDKVETIQKITDRTRSKVREAIQPGLLERAVDVQMREARQHAGVGATP